MKTPTSSPSPTRGLLHWTNKRSRIDWSLSPSRYRGAAAWVLAASPLLRMPPLPARRPMLTTAPGMLLRSLFTRATMVFRANCTAHPHTPSLHPCLGTTQPRAPPPHVPDRVRNGSPAHTPSMPTQGTAPPTSAPTRAPIPRACMAGATSCKAVSRLSSPNHQTFAFLLSQKQASAKRAVQSLNLA